MKKLFNKILVKKIYKRLIKNYLNFYCRIKMIILQVVLGKIFKRKKGISLLIPTQNAEKTVELCIRSMVYFGDEIIVVDNGSTDKTKEIVRELENEISQLTFYDAPELIDLYENRQFALQRSSFSWIARIDSDLIAHTSGDYDISNLRRRILNQAIENVPVSFTIKIVNLVHDYFHTGVPLEKRKAGNNYYGDPPIGFMKARITSWHPGMKFTRLGRWEGFKHQRYYEEIIIKEPYFFHCSFRSKLDFLIRRYRNEWRELGDFKKFPTREDYIKEVCIQKYGISDLDVAANIHWNEFFKNAVMMEYREDNYYPYPKLIRTEIFNMKD